MKYRTYKKWNKKGYHVLKGEAHSRRNKNGVPLFSSKQVIKCNKYDYGSNDYFNYNCTDNTDYDDISSYDLGYD